MSWRRLARKDFEDAVRSRMIWGAIAVFMLLVLILAAAANTSDVSDLEPVDLFPGFSELGAIFLVPVVSMMIGYRAIVGERESGSLRVLFGLSYGRSDVFLGKFASRLGVIAITTLVPTVSILVVGLYLFGELPVGRSIGFVALSVLLGVALTAIAVSASAMTGSRYRAVGGAIGSYMLFLIFWHPLVAGVHYLVKGELAGLKASNWYLFLLRLNPLAVYTQTISSYSDTYLYVLINWPYDVADIPESTLQNPELLMLSNRVIGDVPFYLSDWFAPVTMLLWIVVPAAFAYRRFNRADLN